MTKKFLKCIDEQAAHSAFTDLCLYKNQLFCCFRAATDHISPDGVIKILTLNTQGQVTSSTIVRMAKCDLRDPKLSVDNNGKLILLAYARFYHDGIHQGSQAYVWFSNDGKSFSAPKALAKPNHWLWRLSWFNHQAYGFAYHRRSQTLNLYAGNPLRTFEEITPEAMSLERHGLGYPNESAIAFSAEGCAYAIVRRDADTASAQLGKSHYPYKKWQWRDLRAYIGSPQMLIWDNTHAIIAGRIWQQQGPKTALIGINLITGKLTLKEILPSRGDCSYPGMLIHQEQLYVSYYSMHQYGKCAIYLYKAPVTHYR
ncbi:hypothetical protein [Neptunicella marina]|uniref:Exo-alpha-sialidase n=1 Tax=Neptunicella marina TaxID=2125989 RepID=A0A8J6IW42_9ALTE|nr:hypothetical protein [Neptunicella marina]MBC3766782.1 hypothetical protein [Neptunicella marina]